MSDATYHNIMIPGEAWVCSWWHCPWLSLRGVICSRVALRSDKYCQCVSVTRSDDRDDNSQGWHWDVGLLCNSQINQKKHNVIAMYMMIMWGYISQICWSVNKGEWDASNNLQSGWTRPDRQIILAIFSRFWALDIQAWSNQWDDNEHYSCYFLARHSAILG